jgi:hypothetical protein
MIMKKKQQTEKKIESKRTDVRLTNSKPITNETPRPVIPPPAKKPKKGG